MLYEYQAERQKQLKLLDINSETDVKDIPLPDPERRKGKRLENEAPVWEKFWAWIGTLNPLGGSKLEKAVNYSLNPKETLCSCMLDGRCELSNNVVYSMIETAKANKLNVFQYLYVLLLYMPDHKDDPAAVETLLSWSDFIKEHCKGLIDVETMTPENKPHLPL